MINVENDLSAYPARYFESWNRRDIEFAAAAFTEDVSWTDPSLPQPMTNRDQARMFFESSWAAFPDLRFHALGVPLIDSNASTVAQQWVMRGSNSGSGFLDLRANGRPFEIEGVDVWVLDRSGTATSVSAYYDSASFARQLSEG